MKQLRCYAILMEVEDRCVFLRYCECRADIGNINREKVTIRTKYSSSEIRPHKYPGSARSPDLSVTTRLVDFLYSSLKSYRFSLLARYIDTAVMFGRFILFVSAILVVLSVGSLMVMTSNINTMEKLALAQEEPESEQVQAITAELGGDQELPPVDTIATGLLNLTGNNQSLAYNLALSNMTNATAAHIHTGAENENGKVIVTLYKSESPSGIEIETLAGNITADKLQGPLFGATLDELIGTVNNGTAYVNVHSADFPNGEIRGLLTSQGGEEEEEEEEEEE